MNDNESRVLPRTASLHVHGAGLQPVIVKALEGQDSNGRVEVKPLMVGDDMLMVEFFQEAGVSIPVHAHDDHESIVYLIRGRMELRIADAKPTIAQAGDVWRHPIGVPHSSLALEDCVAVEVKSPPRRTWGGDAGR